MAYLTLWVVTVYTDTSYSLETIDPLKELYWKYRVNYLQYFAYGLKSFAQGNTEEDSYVAVG